ncbi:hypothetical protein NP233_g1892 [Leucocoprinus birnbaumii]|uniref:Uncharacterized protein n=1 Tax=Leucocoprinus birnbaumii TaxID=56174 RepID=A0AAD5VZ65_9AGAR|nr:hypothetical protein NP233_g1892 [Leucocoprinus birnbaumii]
MFIPRIKSKLSTLAYDSSDVAASGTETPSPSSESSENHIDAAQKSHPRKTTVSRLSFPFVKSAKSSAPKKAVKPTSPSRPNSVCPTSRVAPSTPLSKQDEGSRSASGPQPQSYSYQPNPQRHNYRHRGYSRHAFAHIKWFWVMREEDWETRSGPVRLNKPQLDESFLETALDDPLASTIESSLRKRKTPLHPVHQPQHRAPPYDPFIPVEEICPHLGTRKTLWMVDIHLASRDRTSPDAQANDVSDPYDESESESESIDASASSVGYSDDSDETLVDSETESDLSPGGNSSSSIFWDYCVDGKRFMPSQDTYSGSISPIGRGITCALSDTGVSPSSQWSGFGQSEPTTPVSTPVDGVHSHALLARQTSWATDWYHRWQYLIEVSNRGRLSDGKRGFFISHDADDAIDYFSAFPSSSSR